MSSLTIAAAGVEPSVREVAPGIPGRPSQERIPLRHDRVPYRSGATRSRFRATALRRARWLSPGSVAIVACVASMASMASMAADSVPGGPGEVAVEPEAVGRAVGDDVLRRGDAYFELMRATLLVRQQKALEAGRHIREAIELQPDSAEVRAEAGHLLFMMGQRAEAERLAREAIELDPQQARALQLLADLVMNRAMRSGDRGEGLAEALGLYERIAELPDADPEVYGIVAQLRRDAGDLPGAIDAAKRQFAARPADLQAARLAIQLLLEARRGPESVEVLIDWFTRNPHLDPALPEVERTTGLLARIVEQYGGWEVLERRGEELVETQPSSSVAHAIYGEALLRRGDNDAAVRVLERAVELAGEDAELEFFLATAYGSMGRLADATVLAQSLSERFPGHAGVLRLLGETRAMRGEGAAAISALTGAVERLEAVGDVERTESLRRRIASLEIGRGEYREAERLLDSIETVDIDVLELRGRLAIERGKDSDAKAAFQRLRKLDDPGPGVAMALEAEWFARKGDVGKALARYREASVTLGRGVLARGASVLLEHDRADDGEPLLEEWVKDEPDNARAWFAYGSFLERAGRFDDAEAKLARAIELDPVDADALNYLGYSLADRNRRLDEALDLVHRALAIDPWNGAYLDSLGWVFFRMGRFEDALEPLERAAREFPNDTTVLDHLGDVRASLGDPGGAVAAWSQVLDLSEEDDERERVRAKIARHASAADGDGADPSDGAADAGTD